MAIALDYEPILETLRTDLPTLFEQDIDYDIYTRDIFFKDPVNQFKGKLNYRIIFWTTIPPVCINNCHIKHLM